jgi:uncharacterized FlaG/YvyC family protein
MNIKGVVGNLIPIDLVKRSERKRQTQETQDRDPQQGGSGGGEPEQHRFSEEELKEALAVLRENPGIKTHNLQLRVEWTKGRVVVFVEDPTGKIIRRIPDTELWAIVKNKGNQSQRGTLLNKAL